MSETYKPHKLKKKRKLGFRRRMRTRNGREVVSRRRRKGRKKLTA